MRKNCETCKHDDAEYPSYPHKTPCNECEHTSDAPTKWEAADHYKPITNADRIRAMSDEELAHWICKKLPGCDSKTCPGAELCNATDGLSNGLVKWLKQPAEE